MKKLRVVFILLSLLITVTFISGWAAATPHTSLKSAVAAAKEHNLPILIKLGTKWCKECKEFEEAVVNVPEIGQAVNDNVVLCILDAEEGPGAKVAKHFTTRNYPSFILINSDQEAIARWIGFGCQDCFVKELISALDDPITITERVKRFQNNPTEDDAGRLGRFRHNEGMFAEAVAYYRRAQEINPASDTHYEMNIFGAMSYGNYFQIFSVDQLIVQADIILNAPWRGDKELLKVAFSMFKAAKRAKDMTLVLPYLKVAVEETAKSPDDGVLNKRAKLMPEYTLYISKDIKQALAFKKENQPQGWLEDANQLNNFAWWCFENEINLQEAEKLARKAITLAKPGREKGNILDTLAEIRYALGDASDAYKYVQMALSEDPDHEYFQKQLIRFKEITSAR
ncbi:thioredoxin family protein [candidate division CSSED10-310 bacterium]|uniref:Thioredoxin family protein n=1 Tax=candidate division CSSED10-310 bacterium TaxID=2855610 RepID=A0ABV6Z2J7_UNCC1